jgi:hypothetical protein
VGLIQFSLAPSQGELLETLFPGLKPRAESSYPFLLRHPDYGGQIGVENPLQKTLRRPPDRGLAQGCLLSPTEKKSPLRQIQSGLSLRDLNEPVTQVQFGAA